MPAFCLSIGPTLAWTRCRACVHTFCCIQLLAVFACLGGSLGRHVQAQDRITNRPSSVPADEQASAALNEVRTEYEVELAAGKLRVYVKAADGSGRLLIRSQPYSRTSLSTADREEIIAQQAEGTRSWETGKARLAKADADAAPAESDDDTLAGAVQHDALLEVADQFDQALQREPDHLGILRDLCTCYARLLIFEQTSAIAPTICAQAARRLTEFEQKAAPLDRFDLTLVKNIHAWLFFVRGIYPCASEQIEESSGGADAAALRQSLVTLGQDKFEKLPELPVGDLKCEVYGARGNSPHPDFLWGEVFFVISTPGDKRPEHTVAYVLTRCGTAPAIKYYLYFRSLNDAAMLKFYGSDRPALPALRGEVEQFVKTAMANGRMEK